MPKESSETALPRHPLPELQQLYKAGKSGENRTDAYHLSRNRLLKTSGRKQGLLAQKHGIHNDLH